PHLRASFFGATMHHTTDHFVRSVFEGTSYSIRDCLDLLKKTGYHVGKLKLTGGGSKSGLWRQILSDVLGEDLVRTNSDGSVLGIAMLTGTVTGIFADHQASFRKCTVDQGMVAPVMKRHQQYSALYEYYKEITTVLQPIYQRMAVDYS